MRYTDDDMVEPVIFPATAGGNVALAIGRAGWLYGWAVRETTGAAGLDMSILMGADANADEAIPITLLAGGSTREGTGNRGLYCQAGIVVKINSGSGRGSVWWRYVN